jgi:hypothetical protein
MGKQRERGKPWNIFQTLLKESTRWWKQNIYTNIWRKLHNFELHKFILHQILCNGLVDG